MGVKGCIRGREVIVSLRDKRTTVRQDFHVIIPAPWTKAAFLRYARDAHPDCTVRIVQWMSSGTAEDPWEARLWLANPADFRDYPRGIRRSA